MIRKFLPAIFTLPVMALLLSFSSVEARPRVALVYEPEPIAVEGKSLGQVKKGIRKVLFQRNWKMKEVKKGLIRATYYKSSKRTTLRAVVNIHYTKKSISIKYYGSEGFSYNKSAGTIHTRFNSWVKNVEKDMRVHFGAY